jgi:phosphopantothenoylcysteine decarboxylase/phosphopantothenate--cysteine ligase
MARILITSGPTRQYLDPVRYLTNASSGRMGQALAAAAIAAGHEVVVVSGPVEVEYPSEAEVVPVVSTDEMLAVCQEVFPRCDGLIGVAAPCDYRPARLAASKIKRTGLPLLLELVETPDIIATLGRGKGPGQWAVAFALETDNGQARALEKLRRKGCDLIVLNTPSAIHGPDAAVEILAPLGEVVVAFSGSKIEVAQSIFRVIAERLMVPRR